MNTPRAQAAAADHAGSRVKPLDAAFIILLLLTFGVLLAGGLLH